MGWSLLQPLAMTAIFTTIFCHMFGQNPRYYALIEAFEHETGIPLVLNTSFNENEPIVCTPQEALDCFLRTRMDLLVMGNWMVRRPVPPLVGEQASEVHAGYAGDYLLEGGGR